LRWPKKGSGGAPWRCGTHCGVDEVQEQSEKAVASEVLMEEDDDWEIPWPGFASRCSGQTLGVEGRGDGALLLVRSDSSEVTHRWLTMTGEVVADVGQSSEEAR
jgi:hypothetical protein